MGASPIWGFENEMGVEKLTCKYKAIKVNGQKIDEHRYLMEQCLGRKLGFNEIVHHKDGNPRNNDLKNLELKDRAEHTGEFMKGKRWQLGWKWETHKVKNGKYWCNCCKQYLDRNCFWRDESKKHKIRTFCKNCSKNKRMQM